MTIYLNGKNMFVSDALSTLHTREENDVHGVIPLNLLHPNRNILTTVTNILHATYTNIQPHNKHKLSPSLQKYKH